VAHKREIEEEEEEEKEKEDETPPRVSHTETCHALETVLEQQAGVLVSTTVMLNSLLVEATRKR